MKKILKFRAVALLLSVVLMFQMCYWGYAVSADSTTWSGNLVSQANLNLTDYEEHMLDITLDEDTTYKLSFDVKFNKLSTSNLCVILRQNGSTGYYMDLWGSQNQIRIGSAKDGNGWPTLANSSLITSVQFTEGTTYSFSVLLEPEAATLYVNGNLVHVMRGDFSNHDTTVLTKIADAQCGFLAQNSDPDIDVKNIKLVQEEVDDEVWGENLSTMADSTFTDYEKHMINVALDRDSAYKLEFDVNIANINTTNFAIICKEAEDKGYYVDFWFSIGQIRISTAADGNGWPSLAQSTLVNNTYPMPMSANQNYKITVIIQPEKIYLYVDDTLVNVTMGDDGAYATSDYTPCDRLTNAKCGFLMQNSSPNATFSNITLRKSSKDYSLPGADMEKVGIVENLINAIGTVTIDSKAAIEAARAAYDALEMQDQEAVTSYSVLEEAEKKYAELTSTQDLRLYSLDATYALGYNYWGSMIKISNKNGGGMHVEYTNSGTNVRQLVNRAFALDGMHAVFSDFNFTSSAKTIAFYFADYDNTESYSQLLPQTNYVPLALVLNAADGTLNLGYVDGGQTPTEQLAQNDNWKADKLKDKEVSLKFNKNGDGYTVTFNGATAEITKAQLERANHLTQYENVYMTICAFGSAGVSASFNILSLHSGDAACADDLTLEEINAVLALIDKIDTIGTVTAESLTLIAECENDYDALSETQKKCVSNYNTLLAARYRVSSLSDEDLFKCIQYYYLTTEDVDGPNYWPSNLYITDLENGGVNYEWFNGGTNIRSILNKKLKLDGTHIVFDNLTAESSNKKLAIFVADLYDTAADWTSLYSEHVAGQSTCVELIFDFSNGTLVAHLENYADTIIINDSRLTYEFLQGIQWDMKFKKAENGDYEITVMGVTGVLPASYLENATRVSSENALYFTLSPYGVGYNISVDVLALHGGDVVCADDLTPAQQTKIDTVVNAIYDIYGENWSITPASEAKIENANNVYDSLDDDLLSLVPNLQDLETAEEVMPVVKMINELGEINLTSGDDIEAIRDMYKLLSASNRKLVGNYSTYNAAVTKLYNLRKDYIINGKYLVVDNDDDEKSDKKTEDVTKTDEEIIDDVDDDIVVDYDDDIEDINDDDSEDEDDTETEKEKKTTKITKKKKGDTTTIVEEYTPWGLIIGIAAGVLVLAGVVVAIVISKRRKKGN